MIPTASLLIKSNFHTRKYLVIDYLEVADHIVAGTVAGQRSPAGARRFEELRSPRIKERDPLVGLVHTIGAQAQLSAIVGNLVTRSRSTSYKYSIRTSCVRTSLHDIRCRAPPWQGPRYGSHAHRVHHPV